MNQLIMGIRTFIQSIVFSFRHAQLFLYIALYSIAHSLMNRFLFPSLNINAQTINEQITIEGNYSAGITHSFSSFVLLQLIVNVISFFIFYMLIIAITDYSSHLIHKRRTSMLSSLGKGFSKIGNLICYSLLKIIFFALIGVIGFTLVPSLIPLTRNPAAYPTIRLVVSVIVPALGYLVYEAITFYFFPAITIDNMHFVPALKQSWKTVKKTIFALIGLLLLGALTSAALALTYVLTIHYPLNFPPALKAAATPLVAIGSTFPWTMIAVFKTILYEKANGTLPKAYDHKA